MNELNLFHFLMHDATQQVRCMLLSYTYASTLVAFVNYAQMEKQTAAIWFILQVCVETNALNASIKILKLHFLQQNLTISSVSFFLQSTELSDGKLFH